MKKLTEYKPLTIGEAMQVFGEIENSGKSKKEMAKYVKSIEKTAQELEWPVMMVHEMQQKFNNSDDLSQNLH